MGGSAPWNKWDWDYLWHFLGGLAINYILVVIPLTIIKEAITISWGVPSFPLMWGVPLIVILVITFAGYIREKSQHEWERLTAHQWLEALLWGAGAFIAALLGFITLL